MKDIDDSPAFCGEDLAPDLPPDAFDLFTGKYRPAKDREPVKRLYRGHQVIDSREGEPFDWRHGWVDRADPSQEPTGPPILHLKDEQWKLESLEAADELSLIDRAQAGDKAASDTLFRYHYRQVRNIARPFKRGLGADDAIAIACRGFFYAMKIYEPLPIGPGGRAVRLNTHARYWIREALLHASRPKQMFGLCGVVPKGERFKFQAAEPGEPGEGAPRDVGGAVSTETWAVRHGNFQRERRHLTDIESKVLRNSFGGDSLERAALAQDEALTRRIKQIGRRAAAQELVERRRAKAEFLQHEPKQKGAINEQSKKRREGKRDDQHDVSVGNGAPHRASRERSRHAESSVHQVGMRKAA